MTYHEARSSVGKEAINTKRQSEDVLQYIYPFLVDKLDEGIHVVDERGKTVIYNAKMAEIEAMRPEDVLNKNLLDVFKFKNDEHSTLLVALKNGQSTQNIKQTYFNLQGKSITTINHTFPIAHNGKIIGAVEIAQDITKMERILEERVRSKSSASYTFESIIGKDSNFRQTIEEAKRAARTNSSVLIVGETGTGKELVAQSIHHASPRRVTSFISQNCAALPDTLIEGILFGTSRGAFTGAIDRPGLLELADGGTLLLDELNSLSTALQAKLLRVIQEKTIRRVGGTSDKPVDIRIIATMNEDPMEAIGQNRLRKDLYYRLGVVTIFVPPLRERNDDIPLLTESFIHKYNRLFGMQVTGITDEVMQFFLTYNWPGNIRELEHTIEGAMNLIGYEPLISTSHLPFPMRRKLFQGENSGDSVVLDSSPQMTSAKSFRRDVQTYEREYLEKVLERNLWNITRAAQELSMSRQNLQYRLKKFGIRPKHQK